MPFIAGSPTLAEVSTGTAITIAVPGGVLAGELLVALVAESTSTATVPATPAGWTLGKSSTNVGINMALFYRWATASEPTSYTFSGFNTSGASRISAQMMRLNAVDTTTPIDVTANNATSSTAGPTVPSMTTTLANELVIYAAAVLAVTADDFTPPPGTTLILDTTGIGRRMESAYEGFPVAGATGSAKFTKTNATSNAAVSLGVAFRPGTKVGTGDLVSPTVPSNVTATVNSPTQVTVAWSPSTDDTAVASYRVRRGGVDVATVTGTSFVDTGLTAQTTYSYTVSAADAAGNRSVESAAASVTTPAPSGSLVFAIAGTPTGNSVPVSVKTAYASQVRLKVAQDAGMSTGVGYTPVQVPDVSQYSRHMIVGLQPDTAYWYQVEVDGVLSTSIGRFTTDNPGAVKSFRVAFASCLTSGNTTRTSFDNILANAPDLFLHLGDWHYDNSTSTTQATHQTSIENQIAVNSGLHDVLTRMPLAYQWSDHDSGNNDWTGGPAAWTPSYNAAYREVIPVDADLPTGGIYRSFGRGRVKFILTDGRSFKSPSSATDNASKTMFGTAQEAWIAAELADPAYPVKVICLDVPYVEVATAGSDKWGGYKAAAQRLVDAIHTANAKVFLIHGDSHALLADDGTSIGNTGSLPVAGAAPLGNSTSIKGGPYSQGTWPTQATVGTTEQQHGLLDITDTGTAITIRYSGRDTTNTERVTLSKTFDVAPPTEPGNVTATPTGTTQITVSWTPSTDDAGVASYRVRRDGSDLTGAGAIVGTSFVDTTVTLGGVYNYTVSAVDTSGNRSAEAPTDPATTVANFGSRFTTVVHHLIGPDGLPIIGRTVTITLMLRLDVAPDSYDLNSPDPFTQAPISRSVSAVSDANGLLSWNLVPNDQIVPSGTYYEVHGLGGGRTFLYVAASEFAVEMTECVLTLVELGSANLVLVQGPRGRQGGDNTGGLGIPAASTSVKGILELAGDLGGTADEPTVVSGVNHSHTSAQIVDATNLDDPNTVIRRDVNGDFDAAGMVFSGVDNSGIREPRIYNPDTSQGAAFRIGNPNGDVRFLPYGDGTTYIQVTQSNLSFSGLNAAQGTALSFNFATTTFTGTVISGSSADPTTAAQLSPKAYVDKQMSTRAAIAGDLGGTPGSPTVPGLATKANLSHTHSVTDLTATGTRDSTKFLRGDNTWAAAATLDGTGKIPQAQLPSVALTDYLGAVASQTAMLALVGQRGDWATRTDLGTDWQLIADDSTLLASWRQMTYPASPVSSVAGRTGAVTLSSTDVLDSTTTGRSVMTAASAAAARTAIGAGTGNGNVTGTGMTTIAVVTQAAYTALGTKDANTLYVIVG